MLLTNQQPLEDMVVLTRLEQEIDSFEVMYGKGSFKPAIDVLNSLKNETKKKSGYNSIRRLIGLDKMMFVQSPLDIEASTTIYGTFGKDDDGAVFVTGFVHVKIDDVWHPFNYYYCEDNTEHEIPNTEHEIPITEHQIPNTEHANRRDEPYVQRSSGQVVTWDPKTRNVYNEVNSHYFGNNEANVACKTGGYKFGTYEDHAESSRSPYRKYVEIVCSGEEKDVRNCSRYRIHNYNHCFSEVKVKCYL